MAVVATVLCFVGTPCRAEWAEPFIIYTPPSKNASFLRSLCLRDNDYEVFKKKTFFFPLGSINVFWRKKSIEPHVYNLGVNTLSCL